VWQPPQSQASYNPFFDPASHDVCVGDDPLALLLCACASLCRTCWQSVHISQPDCQPALTDCVLHKVHEVPKYAAVKIWNQIFWWFALITPFRVVSALAQLQRIMHVICVPHQDLMYLQFLPCCRGSTAVEESSPAYCPESRQEHST